MALTYEPIASTTLGSNTATVSFSSLPGTFTDLILIVAARNTTVPATMTCWINLNGDTGTTTSATFLSGSGSAASSIRLTSMTNMQFFNIPAANAAASMFGTSVIQFMSYANTNVYKTILAAATDPGSWVERNVGLWRSTSAITTIQLGCNGGNFASGSTFSLFGIKAAA